MVPSVLLLDDGELEDIQMHARGAAACRSRGSAAARSSPGTPPPARPADRDAAPHRRRAAADVSAAHRAGAHRRRERGLDRAARAAAPLGLRLPGAPPGAPRGAAAAAAALPLPRRGAARRAARRGRLRRLATAPDCAAGARSSPTSRRAAAGWSRAHPIDAGRRIRVNLPEALETGDPIARRRPRAALDARGAARRRHRPRRGDALRPASPTTRVRRSSCWSRISRAARRPCGAARRAAPCAEPASAASRSRPRRGARARRRRGAARRAAAARVGAGGRSEPARPSRDGPAGGKKERRVQPRATYELTVPAFGKRALRVLVGRDLSVGGMRIERLPALEVGDRLHLAIYGAPDEAPFLVWGTVVRDDGDVGHGRGLRPARAGDRTAPRAARHVAARGRVAARRRGRGDGHRDDARSWPSSAPRSRAWLRLGSPPVASRALSPGGLPDGAQQEQAEA